MLPDDHEQQQKETWAAFRWYFQRAMAAFFFMSQIANLRICRFVCQLLFFSSSSFLEKDFFYCLAKR
jgi:hypothetical protein